MRRPQGLQKPLLFRSASLETSKLDFGGHLDLLGLDFGPVLDTILLLNSVPSSFDVVFKQDSATTNIFLQHRMLLAQCNVTDAEPMRPADAVTVSPISTTLHEHEASPNSSETLFFLPHLVLSELVLSPVHAETVCLCDSLSV